jgi:regulator of sirC expression with transglutaminase-like and TPR domain
LSSPRAEFARIAGLPDSEIDLAEAALWIAAEEQPEVDVVACLRRLDALAAALAPGLSERGPLADQVARLNRFLFAEQGFRGNQRAYYDPRNSFLDQVIERRLGIPITLALVYMAVAGRVGLDCRGISFPGHFLVKCVDARDGELVVDPFAGAVLSRADCQRRLDAAAGRHLRLDPAVHLRAAAPREILARVLANLKQIYYAKDDLAGALACCDRILLLTPDALPELREREDLRARVRVH